MTKIRIIIFLLTIVVVSSLGYIISLYARGYRFDSKTFRFVPSGLFVVKSTPEAAQIYIDGELETATNANLSLAPGTYDISLKKEGYHPWNKRMLIEKEVVTEVDAHLFKIAPSLSAVTLNTSFQPISSPDTSKIAYAVPASIENVSLEKEGLWIIDTIDLPLGFSRDPRRITNGDLNGANWVWSPDGRQILLSTTTGFYLLDAGSYTPQDKRVNIANKVEAIKKEWEEEREKILTSKLRSMNEEIREIFQNYGQNITFSPDETKILYTVLSDVTIPNDIIKAFPGASTQKQERNLKKDNVYVYDVKEDRNFHITEKTNTLQIGEENPNDQNPKSKLIWFSTSKHLLLSEESKITILDCDGTNRQPVYTGSYINPYAFSTLSTDRLLILTNLGSDSTQANLYSVSIK